MQLMEYAMREKFARSGGPCLRRVWGWPGRKLAMATHRQRQMHGLVLNGVMYAASAAKFC